MARGQGCLLGQEGLVDQGVPSLQGAHVALVAPRDLQGRAKDLGGTDSCDVTDRETKTPKGRGLARVICLLSDKPLGPQSSRQVNGTLKLPLSGKGHRDSEGWT